MDPQGDRLPRQHRRQADDGIGTGGRRVAADVVRFLDLRLQLALLEGREAGARYARATALALAGAALFIVAELALSAAAVGLATSALQRFWPGARWEFVAVAVAALHVAAGLAALHAARRHSGPPPFTESLDQLKKDHQWLTRERTTPPR
jgi:uncharacterized membrane protein YqjE